MHASSGLVLHATRDRVHLERRRDVEEGDGECPVQVIAGKRALRSGRAGAVGHLAGVCSGDGVRVDGEAELSLPRRKHRRTKSSSPQESAARSGQHANQPCEHPVVDDATCSHCADPRCGRRKACRPPRSMNATPDHVLVAWLRSVSGIRSYLEIRSEEGAFRILRRRVGSRCCRSRNSGGTPTHLIEP